MSVLFNVRRVDGVLLAALRREPSLTDLCVDEAARAGDSLLRWYD